MTLQWQGLVPAVTAAQDGDVRAFAELVEHFQDMAVATAFGWLGDFEGARDAAQEAFFLASRSLGQLREPASFAT